jgi:hypothetical protein
MLETTIAIAVFLNRLLGDIILRPEFDGVLRIFPGLKMAAAAETKGPKRKRRKLHGTADYTISFGKEVSIISNSIPRHVHRAAVEAKTSFVDEDLWHCVAQSASLYKIRLDQEKHLGSRF